MVSELSNAPPRPGVYIFKGPKSRVLYVGKAKNLRNRLRSYFQESAHLDPRKAAMVRTVKDFSYIVTDTELEALILEANLIKQYKPRFNIVLRDDKNYPYLKLTITEDWPRIEVVRRITKDGNLYFGPYVPAQAMWETLAFIRRNFSIRTCGYLLDRPRRPCVQYQMKRCSAPCAGALSREEYTKVVEDVRLFLQGEKRELLARLDDKMQKFAEEMMFEEAAKVRDRIFKLKQAFESQKVLAPELGDIDVIGYYRETAEAGTRFAIHVLFIRNGVLIGARDFFLEKVMASEDPEILHSFIELFYAKEIIPPAAIVTNVLPDDAESLTTWLGSRRGDAIKIEVPVAGKEHELLMMAKENARLVFNTRRRSSAEETLATLKDKLGLQNVPLSIGAFDVSTIQGSESVGAFVYWEHGEFQKEYYRHLRIKAVQGVDDYSMMKEIVERTVKNLADKVPDLIVIDGGKGHLDAANQVLRELAITREIIGVAKKPDRAFLPDDTVIDLEDRSAPSLLLKRIRDEVHRFAITFHRKLRDKRLMVSALEEVPGIGKKRRLELLRCFGSIDTMRKASVEEITKVKGVTRQMAEALLERIKKGEVEARLNH